MARIKLLTARQVLTFGEGFYADGANLYLRVRESGSRSFVFRYKRAGRVIEMGLGSVRQRSLAQARDLAGRMRTALADGRDPAALLSARGADTSRTFEAYALELIEAKRVGFRNAKHIQQWQNTLQQYAYPTVGAKLPKNITLADVRAVLSPLWTTKTETASRLRQRIEAVIDYAAVHEGEDRLNPARWRGNLDKVLQAPRKIARPKHHTALSYGELPAIMATLREKDHVSALCLRFTILTAARSGEARGATWSEIDEGKKTWTVPAGRMKAGREHKVPLCDEALAILKVMKQRQADARHVATNLANLAACDRVFPGLRGGLLSDVAVTKTLRAVAPGVTVHGFRSSFRQWGAETTSVPSDVLELALAHVNQNQVEAAYQRSDLFERRRNLMKVWGGFCGGGGNLVRFAQPA